MSEATPELFSFPAISRKKVIAAFDGGRLTSDGGVMLLAAVERRIGIADRLAALIADPRNPAQVTHSVADILRARMLAIACGYPGRFDGFHAVPAAVSKTCLVRFDNNRYSVSAHADGRPAEIRAEADWIEICQDGRSVGDQAPPSARLLR